MKNEIFQVYTKEGSLIIGAERELTVSFIYYDLQNEIAEITLKKKGV